MISKKSKAKPAQAPQNPRRLHRDLIETAADTHRYQPNELPLRGCLKPMTANGRLPGCGANSEKLAVLKPWRMEVGDIEVTLAASDWAAIKRLAEAFNFRIDDQDAFPVDKGRGFLDALLAARPELDKVIGVLNEMRGLRVSVGSAAMTRNSLGG